MSYTDWGENRTLDEVRKAACNMYDGDGTLLERIDAELAAEHAAVAAGCDTSSVRQAVERGTKDFKAYANRRLDIC